MSFVRTDELSVRVTKLTSHELIAYIVFKIFVTE